MSTKFQLTVLFAVCTLFFAACSAPAPKEEAIDMDKLRSEIQAKEDAYAAAEKAKDAAAVAAYYSDDAISYGRNAKPASGNAAIKERIAKRMAEDTTGNYNVYKVVDLFAEGNTAVEIGSWVVMSPAGAEVENGYYMSYFEKRDGKYVCVRDMNVTTAPDKDEQMASE